jgi:hypothetical protein
VGRLRLRPGRLLVDTRSRAVTCAQALGRRSRNACMTTEPETPRCVVCGNDITLRDDKIVFGPVSLWSDDQPEGPRLEYVLYSHRACRAGRVSQPTR